MTRPAALAFLLIAFLLGGCQQGRADNLLKKDKPRGKRIDRRFKNLGLRICAKD